MNVNGKNFRTIWAVSDVMSGRKNVHVIDQTFLPHRFETLQIANLQDMEHAIKAMQVRGAPLIGAAAAYGVALAMQDSTSDTSLETACAALLATRPTAVNLQWALQRMTQLLVATEPEQRNMTAWQEAANICDEDVMLNQAIAHHGLKVIQDLVSEKFKNMENVASMTSSKQSGLSATHDPRLRIERSKDASITQPRPTPTQVFNILTHCNAGWLATVDWGTALAPIYAAHDAGIQVHVWVDETRPRNQGASLTAWELGQHGVPHTVVSDNAGGRLMQSGQVDMVIVGADRVSSGGDVCNKIGTYLQALAAYDNHIPFYAAVPSPTIDWGIRDGLAEIIVEERNSDEVAFVTGRLASDDDKGQLATVSILPTGSKAANPAFDVTPARLVTGIITESGVCPPGQLRALFSRN